MSGHQADDIRRRYRISDIAGRYGVALKKNGREWEALCPFHNEDTPSFTVFVGKDSVERYQCFGCGEHGDVIEFVRQITGKSFPDALTEIAGDAPPSPSLTRAYAAPHDTTDPYADYQVVIPPENAEPIVAGNRTPRLLNPKRVDDPDRKFTTYTPTLVHPYRTRDGRLIGYVLRVDIDDRKFTPTILWHKNPKTGFSGWSHGSLPAPRPIYRLADLTARPQAQVLLVEGEKCADVGAKMLPDLVTISWCGGGKAWHRTNWQPLKGRSVVIWPDNDAPGDQTMLGAYDRRAQWQRGIVDELLNKQGCRVKAAMIPGQSKPDGWDIADAVNKDGWTKEEILLYLRAECIPYDAARLKKRENDRRPKTKKAATEAATKSVSQPGDQTLTDGALAVDPDLRETPPPIGRPAPREVAPGVISLHGGPVDTGGQNWKSELIYNADGTKVKPKSMENYRLFVTHHDTLRGLFAWNEFASDVYVMRPPPWKRANGSFEPRPWTDVDVISCTGYLERFALTPATNDIGKAISVAAMAAKFNPVTEFFDALTWDGVPRIVGGQWEGSSVEPWMSEYLGADDTPINRAFGMRFLISAVARAHRPGCKVDTMLILESPQGYKKSWALRTLATLGGKSYFTDDLHDMQGKDADLVLQGMLIAEIAEMAAFNRSEYNIAKKFLTKQVGRFRPPYGKNVMEYPRTCILAGTVNPGQTGYLRDPTGARRYWPVRVQQIDNELLTKDREQIWAEAVKLFKAGEQWWLTEDEVRIATQVQKLRYEEDPWKKKIDDFVSGSREVTIAEIMATLAVPMERQTPIMAKRVGDHLAMAGFKKRVTRDMAGTSYTVYDAPNAAKDVPEED